ncbi:MAG: thiamine diphosphokinase [Bacteroidota bacterium]|nr:thiamine diphosphokinase [Bacteroidota bacterium]MDP4230844.1 thiamine diphosphokinase [Bacteroidota bacterium]MDP4235656.1 thiamine diphosphokinase [Bacteroidota bacterium]
MEEEKKHILVLLDGEEPSEAFVRHFLIQSAFVIATDGAAKYALKHNIPLDAIIGDMDSVSPDVRKRFASKGTRIIEDPDQQSNDFEKALRFIISNPIRDVVVLGIHGKRTDHLLTNFSVLLRYADSFDKLSAYDATHEHHYLTADSPWHAFNRPVGTPVSLTPLPEAHGVTTSGLYYPLRNARMVFGEREGLDNLISADTATVELIRGALLVSVPFSTGRLHAGHS